MKTYETEFCVEFCHCDSAGIVYYPHFYTWFDQSTERMFKSMGFAYAVLREQLGLLGVPLLETGATYRKACQLGDQLRMQSRVVEFGEKTFRVEHVLRHADGSIALEGFELRIFARLDAMAEKGLKSVSIPEQIRSCFNTE